MSEFSQHAKKYLLEIKELLPYFLDFIKNPVRAIKSAPTLDWPIILILQFILSAGSGALLGIVSQNYINFFFGIFIWPFIVLILAGVTTLIILYSLSLGMAKEVHLKTLSTLVTLSGLPYLCFHILSDFFAPIDLLGFGCSCLILIVGLVHQFQLDKQKVSRIIGALYLMFVMAWVFNALKASLEPPKFRSYQRVESLDKMQDEVNRQ